MKPKYHFMALAFMATAHVQAAAVTMTADDGVGTTSFNAAGKWSNAAAPSAGNTYTDNGWLLRTPGTATTAYTFAGDSLTLTAATLPTAAGNPSALIFKGSFTGTTTITINNLTINGGQLRHGSAEVNIFTLAGNGLTIGSTGAAFTTQGPMNITAPISGSGIARVIASGSTNTARVVTFASGSNTFTGNIELPTASQSRFALAAGANHKFVIGANGVNNTISGAGAATFNGTFQIDLTNAGTNVTDKWTLVNASVVKTYGATFAITDFTTPAGGTAGSRIWTHTSLPYQFSEATGVLSGPDSDGDGLLDSWEVTNFGDLTAQNGTGDPDGDGSTNAQEFAAGTNPNLSTSWPDADADGLNDAQEVIKFGSITAQGAADDFDGDFATNLEEQTAGTDPANRASFPDTDGDGISNAWETAYGLDPLTSDSSLDSDSDGFTNLQEFTANTSPTDVAITPSKAKLVHRWSFNNSLSDSVGSSTATLTDSTGTGSTLSSTQVLLNGGAQATAAYINLGSNLLKGRKTPVTLELWATKKGIQNWSRVFDFGSGTTEYLMMTWDIGTTPTSRVEWKDATTSSLDSATNPNFALDTEYHIVMSIEPGAGTNGKDLVTWYSAPVGGTLGAAKGSFSANNTLQVFNDTALMLGRSQWAADSNANASYNEFRIWDGALTSTERDDYQRLGPDALDVNDADSDGLPDSWEVAHFGDITSQDGSGDPDGDYYTNAQEFAAGTDPMVQFSSPDSDADGLPDGWETAKFGNISETKAGDFDGDGATNGQEYVNLTNPADNTSFVDSNADGIADGATLNAIDALGTTSFNTNLHWNDSSAPATGTNYLVPAFNPYGNGLRTPAITGDASFAGAKLVLANSLIGGVATDATLVVKTTGIVTIPYLGLDGALINQAGGASMSFAGNDIHVTRTSELWANNGDITVTAPISGAANLNITGGRVVSLSGANTLTGNLNLTAHTGTINNGTLTLASTGSLSFAPTTTGVNNAISGTGTLNLNGTFNIDLTGASTTIGDSWNLVTVTGTKTYGATFNISDFTSTGAAGSRSWTKVAGAVYYQFSEATGTLAVVENPDTDADGLPDAWEVTNFGDLTHDGTADTDGDGVTDLAEYSAGTNPNLNTSWPDTDADGVNDAWEISTFGNLTTATITDKDGDGLLDAWETFFFGSIATQNGSDDSDGDGFTNEQEEGFSQPKNILSTPTDVNGDGIADSAQHTLTTSDLLGTTSFDAALHWNDAAAPAADGVYIVPSRDFRTPLTTAGATSYTFAGAKLDLIDVGAGRPRLLLKYDTVAPNEATTTFAQITLNGAEIQNAAVGGVTHRVAGSIVIQGPLSSYIATNNGPIQVDAVISGNAPLSMTGNSRVTLNAVNTYTGNTTVNAGGLTLGATGSLAFHAGANGVNNAITGTGAVALDGAFAIDTTSASTTAGAAWDLITTTGTVTIGSTFTVTGYTADNGAVGARKWASGNYQFDEATGVLTYVDYVNPDTDGDGMNDAWEIATFGDLTQSATGDFDGDGTSNVVEARLGLDPKSSTSRFAVTRNSSGLLEWPSAEGIVFTVERSETLADGSWSSVGQVTGGAGATTASFSDAQAPAGKAFYRVQFQP